MVAENGAETDAGTYRELKKRLRCEERMGMPGLMVEQDRYCNMHRERRTCPLCKSGLHVMVQYPSYDEKIGRSCTLKCSWRRRTINVKPIQEPMQKAASCFWEVISVKMSK